MCLKGVVVNIAELNLTKDRGSVRMLKIIPELDYHEEELISRW